MDAHDIRDDGRAKFLDHVGPNTAEQRQRARRWCADQALTARDPHAALQALLYATGLQPQDGEAP